METTADAKETLRKFFADHAETELTKGDVEQWLKTLGVALKKKDVYNAAAALAEYLIDVKGARRLMTVHTSTLTAVLVNVMTVCRKPCVGCSRCVQPRVRCSCGINPSAN